MCHGRNAHCRLTSARSTAIMSARSRYWARSQSVAAAKPASAGFLLPVAALLTSGLPFVMVGTCRRPLVAVVFLLVRTRAGNNASDPSNPSTAETRTETRHHPSSPAVGGSAGRSKLLRRHGRAPRRAGWRGNPQTRHHPSTWTRHRLPSSSRGDHQRQRRTVAATGRTDIRARVGGARGARMPRRAARRAAATPGADINANREDFDPSIRRTRRSVEPDTCGQTRHHASSPAACGIR